MCLVLLTAAAPVPAAAETCEFAAMEFAGTDDLLWLGEALPLYLEYYCRSIPSVPADEGGGVRIEALVKAEREKASIELTFGFPDGRESAVALRGDPRGGISWLAELGEVLLREGVLPAGSVLPPGPPTTDGEALRLFAAAFAADDSAVRQGYLEEAVERDGAFYEVRWLLAVTDYGRSDCARAREGFGAVAAGRPDLPAPLMNEALCLLRGGKAEEGAARLRTAAAMRPESRDIAVFQGEALAAAGRLEEAEEVFAGILKRDSSYEEAIFTHALLAARLKSAGAVRVSIEDLATDSRRRGRDYFHRSGQRAFGSGDLPAARTAFELAMIADPEHSPSHLALAVVKYALGEYEEAVDDLTAAAREFGGDPDVYRYLGLSYEKLGNTEAAMDSFRRSAEFLAQQGGGDKAKSLFIESLAESRVEDSFPEAVPGLYLQPLAGFWKGEGIVRVPAGAAAAVTTGADDDRGGAEHPAGPSSPPAPEPVDIEAGQDGAALPELLREKEDQAVRLAQEALAAQKALREAQGKKEGLAAELKKLRQANERLEETVLNRDEALLSMEVTLNEYRNQVDELLSGATGGAKLEAKIAEQEQTIEALRAEITALQDGLNKGAAEVDGMTGELEAEKERVRRLQAQLVEKEQEAEARAAEGGRVLDDRVAELESEKKKLADLLAGFRSDGAAWEKRERDLKEEQRALQGRLSSLEREIGGLEQKLETGGRAAREAEKASEEKAGLAAKMEEQARRSDREREELKKKLDKAEEQVDRLEGEVRQAGKQVSEAEKIVARNREDREKMAAELGLSRKAGEGLQEKIIELEQALAAVERREADALGHLQKNEKRLAEVAEKKEGLDEKLRGAEESVDALKKSEAGLRKDLKALEKELAREMKKKSSLEKELAGAVEKVARLRKDAGKSSSFEKEAASLGRELTGLREELKEKEGAMAELRKRLEEAAAGAEAAAGLETEVQGLTERLEQQGLRLEELGADNARLKLLTERMAKKLRDSAKVKHGGSGP